MLVLSRKPGEKLVIGGGITVTVVEVKGNRVRIGIEAPDDVSILRKELTFWHEGAVREHEAFDPLLKRKTNQFEAAGTRASQ